MDILDILLDILLKPPQPFIGLFFPFMLTSVDLFYLFFDLFRFTLASVECKHSLTLV